MLTDKQKRQLKTLIHTNKPIVIIGANGLTQAVLNEINNALDHHELIKVRVNAEDRDARAQMIEHLCRSLQAEMIQRIGHVVTLFRRNPETPRIQLL